MLHTNPLPVELRGAPFTTSEADAAGVGRGTLRSPAVDHPHHGVYDEQREPDLERRCERLLSVLGPHTWFSHLTGARLHGAPLPFRYHPGEPLHVTTLAGAQPLRRPDVIGWETDREIIGNLHGLLPVLDPAEIWCQLAVPGATGLDEWARKRCLGQDWLVAVADFLVGGTRGGSTRAARCSPADLEAARRRHGRRRGAVALREAVVRVRAGSDSPWETFTRLALIDHGLPEPEPQVPIATAHGRRHADLGYVAERIAIDYQGDEHRESRSRWLDDLTRIQLIHDAGWHHILIGAADIRPDASALAARVRRALARAHHQIETAQMVV